MLLRERQKEFVNKSVVALLEHGDTLGVAPTGAGKTICLSAVVGELDKHYPNFKACILAHRDELTTQNMDKFNKINPHLTTSLFNAESKCWKGQTTFAMVQTLSREEHLQSIPRLNLLVIDEAHHAIADSYSSIIARAKELNPKVKIFGVTATPNRGDKTSLGKVFSNCSDQIKISELINDGHLVRSRTFVIDLGNTREKLKALSLRAGGDYSDSDVANILDSTPLNSEVIRHWQEKASNRKTVVFCSTIEHARHVVEAFNAAEVKAALVTSECSTSEREKVLAGVTSGIIQVLVNVSILTEGWDFPPVSCVILLRQSSYKSTMIQMIGRGLRTIDKAIYPNESKEDCIVLDFGISSIIHGNLEQTVDLKSKNEGFKLCIKCKKKIPKETQECPLCGYALARVYEAVNKAEDPQRVIANFNMSEVDLMERLSFSWTPLKAKCKAMIAAGFNSWCCLIQKGKSWIAAFGLTRKGVQEGYDMPTQVIYEGSKVEAMTIADDFLHKYEEPETSGKLAGWKHAPTSENQLKWVPDEYKKKHKSLTKGDASNYLAFIFNAEPQLKEIGLYPSEELKT